MKTVSVLLTCLSLFCLCPACMTAAQHQQSLGSTQDREMTVGVVQREIRVGMSQADVAEALGSPNIVSTDEQGREVWIYDKISTDRVQSQSSGYATLILFGYSGSAGASTTTQRTLTIIIKFDQGKKVRDFAYHSSKF